MTLTLTLAGWLVVIGGLCACAGSTTALPGVEQSQGEPEARAVAEGMEFTVRAGGTVRLTGSSITIRFERVESDSRCPVDVTCVWAGDAVVRLTLAAQDVRESVMLHTYGEAERSAVFQGRRIALVRVTPLPRSGKAIEQAEYEASFLVTAA